MSQPIKLDIVIPDDHKVQLDLPSEVPAGPAEVIIHPRALTREAPRTEQQESAEGTLADLFAGRIGLFASSEEVDLSSDTGTKFARGLEEKYRDGTL